MNAARIFNNKRGFAYLLISSFLIIVIVVVFLAARSYRYEDKQQLSELRIRTMNDFVKDLDDDMHRATYIAAFRTLVALEDSVTNGSFLQNTSVSFRETFYSGKVNNTEVNVMQNSSFEEYTQRVKQLASSMGLNLQMNVTSIALSQSDPWSIDVHVFCTINLTDSRNVASWMYSKEYTTNIPIYELRDPFYGKYTFNRVPNTIRRLNVTHLVSGTDTTNLQLLVNESYYIASADAPSFLMRFEGRTDPSPYGIESIVNVRALSDQDIEVYADRIKVDYIYFYNLGGSKLCDVQNMPSDTHFVITEDRKDLYEVDGITYSTICP